MTVSNVTKINSKRNVLVQPTFFDLSQQTDLADFQNLVKHNSNINVCNEIESQLIELMKIKNPQLKLSNKKALELAKVHVGFDNFMVYGVWVYYPWNNALVHLLPEKEFIQTRTSRNNYKITPEEQQILSSKRVGIMGLSVGQSIALTMAMERVFGEIRIADFDELELTNLNRIRAGVHQIGLSKVALVAREIAEIDPFLKVTCYWEGITEENINDFLLEGGKLDLVADECDTIHVKFFARESCKAHQIPVLMDTSDRGMLDIERFDLEPTRKIFHGLVDHLDIEKSKNLKTNEEKIAYTLPIIGLEEASERIKASMMEIEQTISTWPQLSSDVTLGGAISTNVIRRIFLNSFTKSGRFYVDTNELIPDTRSISESSSNDFVPGAYPKLKNEDLSGLVQSFELDPIRTRATLDQEDRILTSAIFAPSGANCQPWKWLVKDNAYYLFHDKHYSVSHNDYKDCASHLSMGCATENFILASHNEGLNIQLNALPFGGEHSLKAVFQLFESNTKSERFEKKSTDNLSSFLLKRFTNRNLSKRTTLPSENLDYLQEVAQRVEGAKLEFLTSNQELDEIGKLMALGDKIRFLNPQSHYELFNKELRKTEEENLKYRDGIDMNLMDLTASEKIGLEIASNPNVIKKLNEWGLGDGLGKMSRDLISSSSAVGFLKMSSDSALDFFNGGRATEKVWLAATKLDLAFHPMYSLLPYLTRLNRGNGIGFSEKEKQMLASINQRFNALFPTKGTEGFIFLFRLSKAKKPSHPSLRRHKNDIIHIEK